MQLKFLGDAKDSFKWDYHDYLVTQLDCSLLHVVLMLNPDDSKSGGNTKPEEFPARDSVSRFCHRLRDKRNIVSCDALPQLLGKLPEDTDAPYKLTAECGRTYSCKNGRRVVYFDPDTGLEPPSGGGKEHLRFREVNAVLRHIPDDLVVSVFQNRYHWTDSRDLPWIYKYIKTRILSKTGFMPTAIRWEDKMMFIILAKERLDEVRQINLQYCESRSGVFQLPENDNA